MGIQTKGKMIQDLSLDVGAKAIAASVTQAAMGLNSVGEPQLLDNCVQGGQIDQDAIDKILASKKIFQKNDVVDFTTSVSTSDNPSVKVVQGLTKKLRYGSTTQEGAVTSGKKMPMFASSTGDKILDSGNEVYCELTYITVNTTTTQSMTYTNGSDIIQANNGNSMASYGITVGTVIMIPGAPTNVIYVVIDIPTADTAQLDRVFESPTITSSTRADQEFVLSYYKDVTGVKTAHTMDGIDINFGYPEAYTLSTAPSDGFLNGNGYGDNADVIHNHDTVYTKTTDLQKTGASDAGADYINADISSLSSVTPADNKVQTVIEALDAKIVTVSGEYTKTTDLQKTGAADAGADYINADITQFTKISPADNKVQTILENLDGAFTATSDLQKTAVADAGTDYINDHIADYSNITPADNKLSSVLAAVDTKLGTVSSTGYTTYPQYEVVATENVLPAMDYSAVNVAYVQLFVNGVPAIYTDHYTVAGTTITWKPGVGAANYTLAVGDTLIYKYPVSNSTLGI